MPPPGVLSARPAHLRRRRRCRRSLRVFSRAGRSQNHAQRQLLGAAGCRTTDVAHLGRGGSAMTARCASRRKAIPFSANPSITSSSDRLKAICSGGALDLDEAPGAGHHHVHVDLRPRVLLVVEVQHAHGVDDPDDTAVRASCRRDGRRSALLHLSGETVVKGDVCTTDGGRPRATVGLQHVAVHRHLQLPHRHQVRNRAKRPADQALDLLRVAPTGDPLPPRSPRALPRTRGARSTQPSPIPCPGRATREVTRSSTDAVQRTIVLPMDAKTETGSKLWVKSRRKVTGHRTRSSRPPVSRAALGSPVPASLTRHPLSIEGHAHAHARFPVTRRTRARQRPAPRDPEGLFCFYQDFLGRDGRPPMRDHEPPG